MIGFFLQEVGTGGAVIAGAAAIFVIAAIAAFLAFKLMKRTAKMALRMTIVMIILLAAVLGSLALFWFGSGSTSSNQRPRSSQNR